MRKINILETSRNVAHFSTTTMQQRLTLGCSPLAHSHLYTLCSSQLCGCVCCVLVVLTVLAKHVLEGGKMRPSPRAAGAQPAGGAIELVNTTLMCCLALMSCHKVPSAKFPLWPRPPLRHHPRHRQRVTDCLSLLPISLIFPLFLLSHCVLSRCYCFLSYFNYCCFLSFCRPPLIFSISASCLTPSVFP